MSKAFLYIDILGFENLVKDDDVKLKQIFKAFDDLKVHRHPALQTIVFRTRFYCLIRMKLTLKQIYFKLRTLFNPFNLSNTSSKVTMSTLFSPDLSNSKQLF